MNREELLKQQEYIYNRKIPPLINIIDIIIFLSLCNGNGFRNWDDNYFCILEQIFCEAKK